MVKRHGVTWYNVKGCKNQGVEVWSLGLKVGGMVSSGWCLSSPPLCAHIYSLASLGRVSILVH